jgi:CelD/BcsL family acetyltransferase involved in cellulose biosynthesis
MNIDIFSEFNEKPEALWTKFEKSAIMTPFQSYAWLSQWQKTVGDPLLSVRPKIVHLHDEGQTFAIFPFGIRKKYGVKILDWLGGNQADYMGPLLSPRFHDEYFSDYNLFQAIKSGLEGFDLMQFQKQKIDTIFILKNMGFPLIETVDTNAYKASLPATWDEYLLKIKKRIISDSLRQRRRLKKIGEIKFLIADSKETKLEVIRAMMKQKSKQYRDSGAWDMLSINEYQLFFNSLADFSSEIIKVHCAALKVDDSIIATHVGIIYNDTFYYLMPAHETGSWKRYSPGRILLLELLKWSIKNGLKYYDFTIGNESYKKDWCDNQLELYKVIKPITLKGQVFINAQAIKGKINEITSISKKK